MVSSAQTEADASCFSTVQLKRFSATRLTRYLAKRSRSFFLVAFVREQLQIERVLEFGLEAFASQWVLACCGFFRQNSMVFGAAQMQFPLSKAVRQVYREHERAAAARFVRFVRLGQAAQVIRSGDADAMGQGMMVTAEGWNNPAVLRMKEGDALHRELARTVVRMLEPAGL